MQCENGPYRLKEELAGVLDGQDHLLDEWLRITPPPPYGLAFSQPGFRQELRHLIHTFKPGLVIIDPWNRAAEGDKQADYRGALDAVFKCLPENLAEKPAILVIHHLRKRPDESAARKQGRDLLHELAGSYQIGSAARCVFTLETASNDLHDSTLVLTCCKNNDGPEGPPTAWHRRNGLFDPDPAFDIPAFLTGEDGARGKRISFQAVATALRGMAGETRLAAVNRLVAAEVCSKSTAYSILKAYEIHIIETPDGKLHWCEDPT